MKIVHVIASLGMGGAETLLAQIVKRQAQDGHDVHIVTLLADTSVTIDGKVTIHQLSRDGSRPMVILMMARLARVLALLRPEIVHSHMLHSNLLMRLVRLVVAVPKLINTVHSAYETSNLAYRAAYRLLDRLADCTVFVSREAQERYVAERLSSADRSAVVLNGIDTNYFKRDPVAGKRVRLELGIDENCVLITAIGRLTEQKDYPNLFAAFSHVVDLRPDARLLVVGDGELRTQLEDLVGKLDLGSKVVFAGIRRDIPAILSASDLLVLASAWEGFGLVLAEAMACRVPVISTNCGGTAEVLGSCGSLVPIGNSEELASAVLHTINLSAGERQELGMSARARVCKEFSIDQTIRNWYEIYRRLG